MSTDLMPLLAGACLRASVVLGLAWLVTIGMRRASASARHFLWTCAIAAAALVPATALVVPEWRVPAPYALTDLSSRIAPVPSAVQAPARQTPAVQASAVTPRASDQRTTASGSSLPTRTAAVSAAGIAMSLWAIGSAAVLFYMLIGFAGAWWMRRQAVSADARLVEEIDTLAEALEIPRPIPVVESPTSTMPMVCGLWRPLLLMPVDATQWPEERRRVVMLHELAHIKRRDCLTQALAQLVCAAYWFNPLVWIAARHLRAERERACDDFVLAAGTRGSEYAAHLLDIAQAMRPARFSPVAATSLEMARTQLEGRLVAILDPAIHRSPALYTRFAAAAIVALISIPVAGMQLASPEPANEVGPVSPKPVGGGGLTSLERAGEGGLVPPKVVIGGLDASVRGIVQRVVSLGRLLYPKPTPTYLSVDQIARDPARWQGESVSVLGIVQPASRQRGVGGDWRFNIVSQGQTLSVRYSGVVPSTFVDAAEVFVVGELRGQEFSARRLLVRVPG